jgi:Ni/Fe-hydrogenase subunit HybB-like protein
VTADAATVNGLAAVQETGGAISFGDGQVTYARDFTIPVIGTVVPVDVVATPAITQEGRVISLTPVSASLRDTSLSLDLAPFVGGYAFDVCAAQYLPQGTTLTGVAVTPSAATLEVTSPGLPISSSGIGSKGSCS